MYYRSMLACAVALCLAACASKDEPTPNQPKQPTENNEAVQPNNDQASNKPKEDEAAQDANQDQGKDDQGNQWQEGSKEQNKPNEEQQDQDQQNQSKPSEHALATRLHAQLKVSEEEWAKGFDLAPLYEEGKTELYTTEYLSKYLKFVSSEVNGASRYTLTADDLKEVKVVDVKYENSYLYFYTTYKGVRSQQRSSISLPTHSYYAHKVKVNTDFAPQYYAYGTAKHMDLYLGSLLEYDETRYAVSLSPNSQATASGNSISLTVVVKLQKDEHELVQLAIRAENFRSLSHLKTELRLHNTANLLDQMKRYLNGVQTDAGDVSDRLKQIDIKVWAKNLGVVLAEEELHWEGDALKSEHSSIHTAHLYLDAPRFELVKAVAKEGSVILTIKLLSVNGQALEGCIYNVTIPNMLK